MPDVGDLVYQVSSTTGTGNFTVGSVNGKQTFNAAFGTGGSDVFNYFISNRDVNEWEVGTGSLSDSTTLVRDTVIASSNAGSLVNFSAGTKDVTNSYDAATFNKMLTTDGTDTVTNKSIDADNNTITNIGVAEFDTNTSDAFSFLVGSSLDTAVVTASSNGTTITLSLSDGSSGPVRYFFSDGIYSFAADTVSLTPGTDTVPVKNYVYILQSTKALTVSTSSFPSVEHAPVATVVCQSAATYQTNGSLAFQAWTDHVSGSPDDNGHLSHINEWIRAQPATHKSGAALTPTVTTNGGAEDNVDISTTSGVVAQLHDQSYPAFDTSTGSEVYLVNHPTAYTTVTDLNAADIDSSGNSITNNDYTSWVFWGVVSESTGDCRLFCNLPSDFYTNSADAIADSSKYTNYSIPSDYTGTGFLIARVVAKYTTAASGTWAITATQDLRGQFPSVAAGGALAASTEFADNVFRVLDQTDTTKELAFECSGITTGTTRTMTIPDGNGTILTDAVTDTLATGFSHTPSNEGTKSSGTYTPDEADGSMQYIVNGGAFTLAPPTNNCVIILQITNNASAGTITTSGFSAVKGDSFTTTNGDDFICTIVKINGFSSLTVQDVS